MRNTLIVFSLLAVVPEMASASSFFAMNLMKSESRTEFYSGASFLSSETLYQVEANIYVGSTQPISSVNVYNDFGVAYTADVVRSEFIGYYNSQFTFRRSFQDALSLETVFPSGRVGLALAEGVSAPIYFDFSYDASLRPTADPQFLNLTQILLSNNANDFVVTAPAYNSDSFDNTAFFQASTGQASIGYNFDFDPMPFNDGRFLIPGNLFEQGNNRLFQLAYSSYSNRSVPFSNAFGFGYTKSLSVLVQNAPTTGVPEPGVWFTLLLGFAGVGIFARLARQTRSPKSCSS